MQPLQSQFVKTVAVDGVHTVAPYVKITHVSTDSAIYKPMYKCKTKQLITAVRADYCFLKTKV